MPLSRTGRFHSRTAGTTDSRKLVSDPRALESAWDLQYERLGQNFDRMIPRKSGVLVEVGPGEGQLTIPLATRTPGYKIIAVDNFQGPYAGNKRRLLSAISRSGMKERIKVVASDYDAWLARQPGSMYDGVISSEFLPEIGAKDMWRFFADCYRITKPGGFTIHSFLSAKPRNARQRLLIEADSDPKWTETPPVEWFSPPNQKVLGDLRKVGFDSLKLREVKSGLIVRSKAARALLREWDVKDAFCRTHRRTLQEKGIEIPDWIIVKGMKKASTSLRPVGRTQTRMRFTSTVGGT